MEEVLTPDYRMLTVIPESARETFLHYLKGDNMKEVCEQMGVNYNSFRVYKGRYSFDAMAQRLKTIGIEGDELEDLPDFQALDDLFKERLEELGVEKIEVAEPKVREDKSVVNLEEAAKQISANREQVKEIRKAVIPVGHYLKYLKHTELGVTGAISSMHEAVAFYEYRQKCLSEEMKKYCDEHGAESGEEEDRDYYRRLKKEFDNNTYIIVNISNGLSRIIPHVTKDLAYELKNSKRKMKGVGIS
jgi:signal recognition particle subunit SEC65